MLRKSFFMVILLLLLLVSSPATASEADYVERHCQGIIEHVLPDRTRVDCLLPDLAIEYDFGRKWAESAGQALHYAANTGRRAGIVIIIETNRDRLGYDRLRRLVAHYGLPIDIEVIDGR